MIPGDFPITFGEEVTIGYLATSRTTAGKRFETIGSTAWSKRGTSCHATDLPLGFGDLGVALVFGPPKGDFFEDDKRGRDMISTEEVLECACFPFFLYSKNHLLISSSSLL